MHIFLLSFQRLTLIPLLQINSKHTNGSSTFLLSHGCSMCPPLSEKEAPLSLVAVNHICNLGPHSVVSSAQATGAEDGTLNGEMLNRAGSALNTDCQVIKGNKCPLWWPSLEIL